MKNKTIANWLIGSLGMAILAYIDNSSDSLYTLAGIGMWIFGIMAIVRLYKLKNENE